MLLALFFLFLFKKKLFIQTKKRYFPAIFYSRRDNSSLSSTQQQQQHQLESQELNALNQRIFNPNNPATQPLLMQPEQPLVMSIIAPNIEIVPETITPKQPTHQQFFFNTTITNKNMNNINSNENKHFLIDQDNDSEPNSPVAFSQHHEEDLSNDPNYICMHNI